MVGFGLGGVGVGAGRAIRGRAPGESKTRVEQFISDRAHGLNGTRFQGFFQDLAGFTEVKVCFAAGTPLRTPVGSRMVEDIRAGEMVLSRDENSPDGLVVAQVVEEVFVREGLVWHLHLPGGVVIRTTAEHPFYAAGRGWVACHELKAGDRLLGEDGRWVTVEDILDTGEWTTVYNLRVADFHTYFVGCHDWGFSVWAHNADYAEKAAIAKQYQQHLTQNGKSSGRAFFAQARTADGQPLRDHTVENHAASLGF